MKNTTFTVKIEDQEISFKDDEIQSSSQPSPFNIMMDVIPVYFTYKYRVNKEHFAQLEKLSCRLNYLSDYYTCLTRINHFANSKIREFSNIYKKFIINEGFNLYTKLTKIKSPEQSSAKHFHIEFKDEFFRNISQTLTSAEQIKSIAFERSSLSKRIDNFSKYLNKRIFEFGNNISISAILRNFLYYFVTSVEQIWFRENGLYEEYQFVTRNIKSHITIGNHNLQSSAILLSDEPVDDLITGQKDFLNSALKYIPNTFNGFTKIKKLDDAIHFNQFNSQGKKHYNNEKGCFAIMEDSRHHIYFALSGAKCNENYLKDLSTDIKTLLTKGNQKVHVHQCFVTNNMEFYYHQNTIKPCTHEPIRILYKNDTRKISDINRDYACCERKILANKSIPDNNNTFFIRWAPCEKCRPAIHGRYKQIFAFKESSDEKHPYDSSKLIEYDVQKNVDFLLTEKGSIEVK